MNKTIAGYHLLMILSAVDFKVTGAEDMVIRQYLVNEFPIHVSLDRQMEIISSLHPEDWEGHFLKAMDDFYDDATEEERRNLMQFAIILAKADDVITHEENHYLNLLFEHWFNDSINTPSS
ncbi:MAG: TerB family tellurite resistance protein [Flavipsychrobacter sp.]|nr:TerB family tellurite resistance protein [Flavipsychrobacter sp.]